MRVGTGLFLRLRCLLVNSVLQQPSLRQRRPGPCGAGKPRSREMSLSMWLRAQAVPKPCPDAQAREEGARKVWLSDVFATAKSPPLAKRGLQKKDWEYAVFMAVIHGLCLLAPFTFSWQMVGVFFISYFITGAPCLWAAPLRHQ